MEKIHTAIFASPDTAKKVSELIFSASDIELSIVTSKPGDLLKFIAADRPQVVVLEVSPLLPDVIGLIEQIHRHCSQSRCLILAHVFDLPHMRKIVDAGDSGYLLIPSNFAGLSIAIQLVCAGKLILVTPHSG